MIAKSGEKKSLQITSMTNSCNSLGKYGKSKRSREIRKAIAIVEERKESFLTFF